MADTTYSRVLPPEVRQYFAQFDIPKRLFYKLTNPEPVKTPTGTARGLSRPPSGNG